MGFVSKRDTGSDSVRSLYGEPQYEEGVDTDWKSGYYGKSDGDESPAPVEFVTGIEYRTGDDESASLPAGRQAQSLSVSD